MLLLVACQRGATDAADIALKLSVSPNPPTIGIAQVSVTLSDSAGKAVQGAKVDLEGTMTHAGMASETATANEVAPGRYQAALNLTMDGDWFIIVRATLADGRTLERQVNIGTIRAS